MPPALYVERDAWTAAAQPLQATVHEAQAPLAALGRRYALSLLPKASLSFASRTGRTAAAPAFGGALRVEVPVDGILRVALGQRMWIDVAEPNGATLSPEGSDKRLRCAGIAKQLLFRVAGGRTHHLLLSEGAETHAGLLLTLDAP